MLLPALGLRQSRAVPRHFKRRRSDQWHESVRAGRRQGSGVVLLHGFRNTGDMWAPLAAELVKNHTVIVPDLRGLGLSAHPDSGIRRRTRPSTSAGVMDALKVEQSAQSRRYREYGGLRARRAVFPKRITRWPSSIRRFRASAIGTPSSAARFCGTQFSEERTSERLVQGRERIYLDRFYNDLSPIRSESTSRPDNTTLSCTRNLTPCTILRAVWRIH